MYLLERQRNFTSIGLLSKRPQQTKLGARFAILVSQVGGRDPAT